MQMETTELIKVETFKVVIDSAPAALTSNQLSVSKAVEVGEALLAKANVGMSEEVDVELNNFLVKARKTLELMKERRTPITKLFDDVRSAFTGLEGSLDPKAKDGIYLKIQTVRNAWATKKAEEEANRRREAERKLNIEKERIAIQTTCESQLTQYFIGYMEAQQNALVSIFESINLQAFEGGKQMVETFPEAYSFAHFEAFKLSFYPSFHTEAEIKNIVTNVKAGKFVAFGKEYKEGVREKKDYLILRLPAKKAELEAIAKAGAEEYIRLQAESEKRRVAEAERSAKESADKKALAGRQAETNKQVMTANSLFDMEAASVQSASTAQVREGYEIELLHPSGYQQICAFYFEKEGLKETLEKLEKKTLGSMKTFCEKWAKDRDEKIISPYLRYKEVYKAVAKKG